MAIRQTSALSNAEEKITALYERLSRDGEFSSEFAPQIATIDKEVGGLNVIIKK